AVPTGHTTGEGSIRNCQKCARDARCSAEKEDDRQFGRSLAACLRRDVHTQVGHREHQTSSSLRIRRVDMISSDISSMRHAESQCGAHPGMTSSGPSGREVALSYFVFSLRSERTIPWSSLP